MRKAKLFFIFFSLVLITVFIFNGTKPADKQSQPSTAPLQEAVSRTLEETKGTYAVVIKNMAAEESYFLNADKVFEPGSLYKLWVMGAVFDAINKEELKEDDVLSQDIAVLNQEFQIDRDSAELTEGTITLSVADALKQMITISHNYAAMLLAEKIKNSQIKTFIKAAGFNDSDLGNPPVTTARDIASFFEKLYKKELVSKEYSEKMTELLKNQQLNDGLTKYLPSEAKTAHKTGDIGWFKHDAGIVFTDKGDYIIVILSESDFPPGAQERIALISKAVYEYFVQKSKST